MSVPKETVNEIITRIDENLAKYDPLSKTWEKFRELHDAGYLKEALTYLNKYAGSFSDKQRYSDEWCFTSDWQLTPSILNTIMENKIDIPDRIWYQLREEQNPDKYRIMCKYQPDRFKRTFYPHTQGVFNLHTYKSVSVFECILEIFGIEYIDDILRSNVNALLGYPNTPYRIPVPVSDEMFLFYLKRINSEEAIMAFLKVTEILVDGHLLIFYPVVKRNIEAVLNKIDVNQIYLHTDPEIQLSMIKRGFKLTDNAHMIIKDSSVLEYLYDNKISTELLFRNASFIGNYIMVFRQIMEKDTPQAVAQAKWKKFQQQAPIQIPQDSPSFTPYQPGENSPYCNTAVKVAGSPQSLLPTYEANIDTSYSDKWNSKDTHITLFPEEKYRFVNLYPNVHVAVGLMKHDYLRELIRIGADVNMIRNGTTPLLLAISKQDITSVRILLEAGACKESAVDGKDALYYINQLQGQAQKQIMDLVYGGQIDAEAVLKENTILKDKIAKLTARLENKDELIDRLQAEIVALKAVNDSLKHQNMVEVNRAAVLSGMRS